jgi:hypothetical protein
MRCFVYFVSGSGRGEAVLLSIGGSEVFVSYFLDQLFWVLICQSLTSPFPFIFYFDLFNILPCVFFFFLDLVRLGFRFDCIFEFPCPWFSYLFLSDEKTLWPQARAFLGYSMLQ